MQRSATTRASAPCLTSNGCTTSKSGSMARSSCRSTIHRISPAAEKLLFGRPFSRLRRLPNSNFFRRRAREDRQYTFPPRDGYSVGHRSPPSTVLHQREQTRVGHTNPKTGSPQTQKPRQTATTASRRAADRGRRVRPCGATAERKRNGHIVAKSASSQPAVRTR